MGVAPRKYRTATNVVGIRCSLYYILKRLLPFFVGFKPLINSFTLFYTKLHFALNFTFIFYFHSLNIRFTFIHLETYDQTIFLARGEVGF